MIESLLAVAITSVAGAALLSSLGAAVQASTHALHTSVARGLADQLMDEIATVRYPNPGATVPPPPSNPGTDRSDFDDLDDYHGWTAQPPRSRTGEILGEEGYTILGFSLPRLNQMRPDAKFLERLRRSVSVEAVEPDGSGGWTTVNTASKHRRVTVQVSYTDGQNNTAVYAELSRVFSYVPITP